MTHAVVYRKTGDPYMDTEVSFDKSLQEITKLFDKYEVDDLITRKTMEVLEGSGLKEPVKFYTILFKKAGLPYIIEFPVIIRKGPIRYGYEDVTKRKVCMETSARVVYHFIKALLVAVDIGLCDFSKAMMPYLALPDGKGGMTSMTDYVLEHRDQISQGKFDLVMLPAGRP